MVLGFSTRFPSPPSSMWQPFPSAPFKVRDGRVMYSDQWNVSRRDGCHVSGSSKGLCKIYIPSFPSQPWVQLGPQAPRAPEWLWKQRRPADLRWTFRVYEKLLSVTFELPKCYVICSIGPFSHAWLFAHTYVLEWEFISISVYLFLLLNSHIVKKDKRKKPCVSRILSLSGPKFLKR